MSDNAPTSERIVIAGGSGFLGQSLVGVLRRRCQQVIVLTRGAERIEGNVRYVHWDARTVGDWAVHLDGAAGIVNLVGRSVDCRKTPANKKVILESRIEPVNALAAAWRTCKAPPRVWVQSATAHIYGDTGDELLDESSPIGTGFAPIVGSAWEAALADAQLPGCRRVVLRISFVLGRDGGALKTLARLARLYVGGTVWGMAVSTSAGSTRRTSTRSSCEPWPTTRWRALTLSPRPTRSLTTSLWQLCVARSVVPGLYRPRQLECASRRSSCAPTRTWRCLVDDAYRRG